MTGDQHLAGATSQRQRRSAEQMIVPINGIAYRVAVVAGPLLVDGQTAASRVRHAERTIEVDESVPPPDRWRVAALAVAIACGASNPMHCPAVPVVGNVD